MGMYNRKYMQWENTLYEFCWDRLILLSNNIIIVVTLHCFACSHRELYRRIPWSRLNHLWTIWFSSLINDSR